MKVRYSLLESGSLKEFGVVVKNSTIEVMPPPMAAIIWANAASDVFPVDEIDDDFADGILFARFAFCD